MATLIEVEKKKDQKRLLQPHQVIHINKVEHRTGGCAVEAAATAATAATAVATACQTQCAIGKICSE